MQIIDLETHTDKRGNLTVIEKVIPFEIKRIFYIYGVDGSTRGGHRHYKTRQAAICLKGSCVVLGDKTFKLDSPAKCLLIEPEDYHTMSFFSDDAILMVLASEYYNENDYIYEDGCKNKECICHRELYHKNNCAWYVVSSKGEVIHLKECSDYE